MGSTNDSEGSMGQTEETRAMMGNHFRSPISDLDAGLLLWPTGQILSLSFGNHSSFGDSIERQITKLADSQI